MVGAGHFTDSGGADNICLVVIVRASEKASIASHDAQGTFPDLIRRESSPHVTPSLRCACTPGCEYIGTAYLSRPELQVDDTADANTPRQPGTDCRTPE
jgi:hypothetical protein